MRDVHVPVAGRCELLLSIRHCDQHCDDRYDYGTTQLLGPDLDDAASTLTNIGFDLYLQGTRYTHRLGATKSRTQFQYRYS